MYTPENTQPLLDRLLETGHMNYPFGAQKANVTPDECYKLDFRHPIVQEAVRSYQALDANCDIFAQAVHHRECQVDGDLGPATELVLKLDRCGEPDYGPKALGAMEAVGAGNWKRCHGVGDFHSCSIKVNNSPPGFLAPLFEAVKAGIVQSYAEVGLLFRFDAPAPVNINWHFVARSSGWIGLAQVVNNATCSSQPIWCQYLSTYTGGSTDAARTTQWITLGKHELCHNCGIGHTRGGVMNPSIVNGLPISWAGDPTRPALVSRFGGQPIPREPEGDRELWLSYKNPDGSFEPVTRVQNSGGSWFPAN